jgi:uridylate kinase
MAEKKPVTVVSLGGSMIIPDTVNAEFVKAFTDAILERVKKGRRFVIVAGGGKTARIYQTGLREIGIGDSKALDWIGIYATHLNAEVLRLSFGKTAHADVLKDPEKKVSWKTPVLVAGGGFPGWSTDYDAIVLAERYGADTVVNISNIDYVYTADPKKDPTARPIPQITWKDLIAMLPAKWSPGLSSPFDPVAARKAQKLKLTVSIINGASLADIGRALDGLPFRGTVITG